MMTRCGGNRSAATPPRSANTSDGAIWAASTYDRSAAEPVTLSTAKETPTMENPTDAGAISRSVSSSRKSRIPSTGNRRKNPPRDIGPVPPNPFQPDPGHLTLTRPAARRQPVLFRREKAQQS